MEIQNEAGEFEENMPLTVFGKGDLIAFRGSDGYCFNTIGNIKGNILTLHSEDEEDVVIFQREDQWKGGNTQFGHILRKEKDEMVQVDS